MRPTAARLPGVIGQIGMNDAQLTYDRVILPVEDRMIRSIWRIVRDPQDAEDAMQNALATVWKQWDRVCRHPNAQALVLKIGIDAAYDVVRQRLRDRRRCDQRTMTTQLVDPAPTPAQSAEGAERYDALIAAIHRLPRRQATATLMRVVEGQSYREIASVLGCAEVTARKHVTRGRERLQTALARFSQVEPKASRT